MKESHRAEWDTRRRDSMTVLDKHSCRLKREKISSFREGEGLAELSEERVFRGSDVSLRAVEEEIGSTPHRSSLLVFVATMAVMEGFLAQLRAAVAAPATAESGGRRRDISERGGPTTPRARR